MVIIIINKKTSTYNVSLPASKRCPWKCLMSTFRISSFLHFLIFTQKVPFVYAPPPYRRGGAFRWWKRHFQVVTGAF